MEPDTSLLVQVSEQLMPNLLSTITLKPNKVYLAYTDDAFLRGLEPALRDELGIQHIARVRVDPYNYELNLKKLQEVCEADSGKMIFDITGGTKIMALAALEIARRFGLDAYYVNTDQMLLIAVAGKGKTRNIPEIPVRFFLSVHGISLREQGGIEGSASASDSEEVNGVEGGVVIDFLSNHCAREQWVVVRNGRRMRVILSSRARLHILDLVGKARVDTEYLMTLKRASEQMGGIKSAPFMLVDTLDRLSLPIRERAKSLGIELCSLQDGDKLVNAILKGKPYRSGTQSKTILVSLVSDQPVPTLLCADAVKPHSHVFLLTERTDLVDKVLWLMSALKTQAVDFMIKWVESMNPDSIKRALDSVWAENPNSRFIVNVTGGTKMMAAGAVRWCDEKKCLSLYVDTANRRILKVNEFPEYTDFEVSWPRLTLEPFVMAHGLRITGEDTHLAVQHKRNLKKFADCALKNLSAWRRLVLGRQDDSIAVNDYCQFLNRLVNTGILPSGFNTSQTIDSGPKTRLVADNPCLMRFGTPLELFVFYSLWERPGIDDIRWGVRLAWNHLLSDQVSNELDIVLVSNSVVTVISCKLGTCDMREVVKAEQLSRSLGGAYAKTILVSGRSVIDDLSQSLTGEQSKVKMVAWEDLLQNNGSLLDYVTGNY